ncbi:MAG: hypothetical protein JO004_08685 [Methylobacteriaceae bacterium]|nr:hypothetical protein [Methylobacteriaceae bacterium]
MVHPRRTLADDRASRHHCESFATRQRALRLVVVHLQFNSYMLAAKSRV